MEFSKNISTPQLISILYREHAKFLNSKVKEENLSFGLYPLLVTIYKNDGIIQEDLAKIFNLNQSTVTRNLKKLEDKKFIKKIPVKRTKKIQITESGKITARKVMDYDDGWDLKIKEIVSDEEFDNLKKTLKKICEDII